jgi:hypothetical protein
MKNAARMPRGSRLRAGLPAPLLLAVVVAGLSAGSCADPGDRVVLEITLAGFVPSAEVDRLEITVAASRTVTGDALCAPWTHEYAVSTDATDVPPVGFPLRIAVEPGPTYDKILFVRVIGRKSTTVRLKTERMVSLQGGDVGLQVLLTADCIGVGTGAGQHCVGGLAQESPYGAIFDQGLHVETTEPCVVE